MKKYPYVFLGIFIAILVFIIIHIISVPIKLNRKIKVKPIENYYVLLDNANEEINKIKNEECKNSLLNMSDRIRNTYYSEDIYLKDYYKNYFVDDYRFDAYYKNVTDNCDFNFIDYKKNNKYLYKLDTYSKMLASMEFPYEMANRYLGSYQISFDDLFVMNEEIERVDELGTYSNKNLELEVLNELISGVSD